MQTWFGEAETGRNPFMPMTFKGMTTPWMGMSPTLGYDVAMYWMKQWSSMASLDASPMSVFARAWGAAAGPLPVPPADTAADIAFGSATDHLPDIETPPVDAKAVLGLAEAPAVIEPEVVVEPVAVAAPAVAAEPVAAEPVADELTRIVGIGPKLAAALSREGVTSFAQIAAWKAADLAKFDKALDLKGRAVRDAWVAQAKRFAEAAD